MRLKSGVVATFAVAALCCGRLAYGQNKEKPAVSGKPAAAGQTGGDAAHKASDPSKSPPKTVSTAVVVGNFIIDKPESQEEKAIRSSAEAFTKLYNEHDSKGLAALFAVKAEVIDEGDNLVKGRDAIEKAFAEVFKANPNSSMQVDVDSIRVLTPNLAIEEGTTLSKDSPEDFEFASVYVAVHVKIDGQWLLASVRDWPAPLAELTPHDRLLELGWLVGEWIEESPDSIVHTVCKWHDNENFLMQEFKIQIGGEIAMSGTMRIGWDAVSKQFKCWVFDSHGGHSEGLWHRNGDAWVVKSRGATAKGETASSTNVYRQIDGDTLSWQSLDRIVDGERQEDIAEIVIKRRPPSPVK